MTHQQPKRWLSLFAALLLGPLAPCAVAESGQWVAKGTQPKPPAPAPTTTPEMPAGQQPVIIYVPQGTPLPANQPSWVLEGFLKAKENAAKEANAAPKSLTPVESPKPDSSATVQPEPKKFQPPTVAPRIASPVQTPTLAPPIIEGKPEGGGLFRWPDGMIGEYSGDAEPPATPPAKRPKALFAPRDPQPVVAAPRSAPALPPSAPPVPQESQRRPGLVDAPRPSLMPKNRPPKRSAVVKSTPPAPHSAPAALPAEKPVSPPPPAVAQERAEPRSVVVAPTPAPTASDPSDAKALFPRSVISKYLSSDKSAEAGSTANSQPSSRGKKSWSNLLPSDPPSAAKSAMRPPAPALPEVTTPVPAAIAPAERGLAEAQAAPPVDKPSPRSPALKSRGKALFSRSRPQAPAAVEAPIAAPPSEALKPPIAVAGPVDPFSASSKLMPQMPRQAKPGVQQPFAARETKGYSVPAAEMPREELAKTAPAPLGQPSMANLQGSKRRVQLSPPAPHAMGQVAVASPLPAKPVENRFVEQKVAPQPWKSSVETAELSPPSVAAPQPSALPRQTAERPSGKSIVSQSPPRIASKAPAAKPVVEIVAADPQPSMESIGRKPTIVEPEPADRIQAVVSDQSSPAARVMEIEPARSAAASPRPNPVRLREQPESGDSVLTSAVSHREHVEDIQGETQAAPAVRANPMRMTRGASGSANNPLR